jgi:hypothetical protein
MTDRYLDLKLGSDSNGGTGWGDAKKTFAGVQAVASASDKIKIARTSAKNTPPGTWTTTKGQGYLTGSAPLTDYYTFAAGTPFGSRLAINGGTDGSTINQWGSHTPMGIGSWPSVWTFAQSATQAANQQFWYWDFGSTFDWSAFQEVYVYFWMGLTSATSTAYTGDNVRLHFCSGTTGDIGTSLFSIPIKAWSKCGGQHSVWQPYLHGGNLPNNVRSVGVYSGNNPYTVAMSYSIPRIVLCKTASVLKPGNFFYESRHRTWHQIAVVTEDQTSAPKIYPSVVANNNDYVFGSTGSTTVFCLDYFYPETLLGLSNITTENSNWTNWTLPLNTNDLEWEGGYNTSSGLVDSYTAWSFGSWNRGTGLFLNHTTSLASVTCTSKWRNMVVTGGYNASTSCFGVPFYATTNGSSVLTTTKSDFAHINGNLFFGGTQNGPNLHSLTNCYYSHGRLIGALSGTWGISTASDNVSVTGCSAFGTQAQALTVGASAAGFTWTDYIGVDADLSFGIGCLTYSVNTITMYGAFSYTMSTDLQQLVAASPIKTYPNMVFHGNGPITLVLNSRDDISGWTYDNSGSDAGTFDVSVSVNISTGALNNYAQAAYSGRTVFTGVSAVQCSTINIAGGRWSGGELTNNANGQTLFQTAKIVMDDVLLGLSPASSTLKAFMVLHAPVDLYNCTIRSPAFRRYTEPHMRQPQLFRMFGGSITRGTAVTNWDIWSLASYSDIAYWNTKFHNVTFGQYITQTTLFGTTRIDADKTRYTPAHSGAALAVFSNYNKTPADTRVVAPFWRAETTDLVVRTEGGKSWKVTLDSLNYPSLCKWEFASVAVRANKQLVARAYVWTVSAGKVYFTCPAHQVEVAQPELSDVSTEQVGQWEMLELTHTPTEDGVMLFYFAFENSTAPQTLYIDDVSFTQV